MTLHPIVLSGGSGTRLWPLSRAQYPKQFLSLTGEFSLLQETLLRVADEGFATPLAVSHADHRFIVAEQISAIRGDDFRVLVEPVSRGTAAAVIAGALLISEEDPEAILVAMPSDHIVRDTGSFTSSIKAAAKAVRHGGVALLGIKPSRPETGYGYIKSGSAVDGEDGVFEVDAFVEKPSLEDVEEFLADGKHHWNAGIFIARADHLIALASDLAPEIVDACRGALADAKRETAFTSLDEAAFARAPVESFDTAVMEKLGNALVLPSDMGWSDVGAWSSLWELGNKDEAGNVLVGDAFARETENCYIRSDDRLVAAVGVRDLVLVSTKDAVIAVPRDQAQMVKVLAEELRLSDRCEADQPARVTRPWGWYESINVGKRFQVKILQVNPGAQLSKQMHFHRAEHWVVVSGTAKVELDSEEFLLSEKEATFIDVGRVHRVTNPGRIPLLIVEVQCGGYLGEDDIVRFQDVYGRVPETAAE